MLFLGMIEGSHISHSYFSESGERKTLANVDFNVNQGEFVVVLGHNGSGKSTLARHLNGLIPLQSGSLSVAGIDVSDTKLIHDLRSRVGMVFQNPDNQFVSSEVAEDIAFGPENYGLSRTDIVERVRAALDAVGMSGYETWSTRLLSGGQKQRIALAGVLAMDQNLLVFDESTSMLDPEGRAAILDLMHELCRRRGHTVILISQCVEEAINADRVYVLAGGAVVAAGSPQEILSDADLLDQAGVKPPLAARLYLDLRSSGFDLGSCPLTESELVDGLCRSN